MRLVGTRTPRKRASFAEAVQACVPSGGGLFVPDPLPCFRDVPRLLEMDFHERSTEVLHRMLGEEFDRAELAEVVREAFDFPLSLRRLGSRIFALELFHGPTLAFQDFGCRFLAGMLALLADRDGGKPRTILAATTGNTGSATASAFWKRKGFRVVVLYPEDRAATCQARQIAALGANVRGVPVQGSYDACQALAARCLEDRELVQELGLTSANSLNIGRIVGQVVLFFEAAAQVQALSLRDAPVLALPCGNGGNLYAGLLARGMGLPVKAFVAATNGNDALVRGLESGSFRSRPAVATLSRDLDAGAPSNWERILAHFGGQVEAARATLRWGRCGDAETRKAMWELHAAGCMPDPASAVAHAVLQERLGLSEVGILLATAHPAKSAELLRSRMNLDPGLPEVLAGLPAPPDRAEILPAELEALKHALLS